MDNRPIAVIDSGLGGLSILQAVKEHLPQESTIYLADHEFFPYGNKTKIQINRRLTKLISFLLEKKVKLVIIACNTITTSSIKFLRQLYSVPFIGTEPAIKPAIEANLKENIYVLSTQATAKSKSFNQLINQLDQKGQVKLLSCPRLAEGIEKFASSTPKLKLLIKSYLDKIKGNYSALVLGCTHYILVKDIIKKLVPPHVIIIEPTEAIAKQVETLLSQSTALASQAYPTQTYLTTKNPQLASSTAFNLISHKLNFSLCSL